MEINQKTHLEIEKDGKLVQLVCPSNMPLGQLFDALMEFKGFAVQKMAKAHQDEIEEAKEKMGDEPEQKEEEDGSDCKA